MRIVFDQGTPAPLRHHLREHEVVTAFELGWERLSNGELLAASESAGFEAMISTDQNLAYQQNLTGRKIAVIVLDTTNWPRIEQHTALVIAAIETLVRVKGIVQLLPALIETPELFQIKR